MPKIALEAAALIGVVAAVLAGSFHALGTVAHLAYYNALGFDAHQFRELGSELHVVGQDASVGFVVNGHTTAIQPDALISLVYSMPAFYRNRGAWIMNGSTLALVRKLKDGQNNYLWQPAYRLGEPEILLGRPCIEAVDMPDVPSGSFPIAFGDWSTAYRIYDKANGFSVMRDPYSVATKSLVRFHARRRVGGQTVMGEAVKKLKMSAS